MSRVRSRIAALFLTIAWIAGVASGAIPPPPEAAAPGDAIGRQLSAIAGALQRIEELMRRDSARGLVDLRFKRLELLQNEITPLRSELRLAQVGEWDSAEMRAHQLRLENLDKQIEEARLRGNEDEARNLESAKQEVEISLRVQKARMQAQARRAEEIENRLADLMSQRDAAVAEIDRLLARLEAEP